ncbi:tetratricopeptide repeat protein [Pseudoalteromonas atlantica]|uniref:tetratricopeptide repeat protein n=1 Tax=Pseudoalteromonas atlantica TaxID=288 RepID=UPI00373602A0
MRFFLLLVFLWGLPSVAFATTAPNSTPVNSAPIIANTQNSQDLMYQQLFSMQSQLVRLDEKLQQQKSLGNDIKTLEAAQQALKVQLANLQTKLDAQKNLQANKFIGFSGRIGDLKDSINWWFSILTIFLALGGLLIYKLSRKEAENVAHQQMEGFISSNADKILANAQVSLEKQLGEANTSVEYLKKYIDEAHQIIEEKRKEVEAAADDVQRSIAEKQEPNPESLRILENSTNKISKGHTTAREYLNLASVGYGKNNYKEALKYLNLAINTLKESEKQTRFHAQLLWNTAIAHSMLHDVNAELKAYDGLIQNFKSMHNEESWSFVARAMLHQGVVYAKQEKFEDALASYAALIERFKDSSNEEIQIQVARAMANQGFAYGQQEKFEDALASYAALIERFKDSSNEELQIRVAKAMGNQGVAYSKQDKLEDALNSYATLIEQFKDSSNEELQLQVVNAMANQGVAYGQQGKYEDALSSFATLIEQFKDSSNEEIQLQVANAMGDQGVTYGQQGKFDDALSSFATLIEQFKGSSNEEIQKTIANSRANIAEQALLYEAPEQVLTRVAEAEKYSENPQILAVMQFIRFLLDNKTIEEVFTALNAIPTEMTLAWGFREIKDYLTDNFEGTKQQQIQAVVQYFEQHKDIERLRVELGIKG